MPASLPKADASVAGVSAGLEPYVPSAEQPWDYFRALHLLRRTRFGVRRGEVLPALAMPPADLVDQIIDEALALDVPGIREDVDIDAMHLIWTEQMLDWGLRERMAFFWSGHFVTEQRFYVRGKYITDYLQRLRTHALGNFRELTRSIGISPAMLIYLDGAKNVKGRPNENYARELLELFTVGEGLYTQQDIVDLSRALTGWGLDYERREARFYPYLHDDGEKTILGRTGRFGYNEAVDLIFEERPQEIARFVCAKLYRHFVYAHPKQPVLDALAEAFVASGFEIAPLLRMILKSAHFFDEAFIGAKIKSPVEFVLSVFHEGYQLRIVNDKPFLANTFFGLLRLEQVLFNPPSVSGWPEHRDWMSSSSVSSRVEIGSYFASLTRVDVDPLWNDLTEPWDPYLTAQELTEHVFGRPLSEEEVYRYTLQLLGNVPDYEWDPTALNSLRLRLFMQNLLQRPEAHLT
ncbi:MAG: DUF1800 domain-containing protein [Bacteroidota bacterium]